MPITEQEKIEKFSNTKVTAKGEQRAFVEFGELETLWFNTGTKCNLSCQNCYIESSPTNNRLEFLQAEDIESYINEIKCKKNPIKLIGFTGGEPFINPNIIELIENVLKNGFELLVLTNAYRVLNKHKNNLQRLLETYGSRLHIRVSLDHFTLEGHEKERGKNTFAVTMESVKWLHDKKFNLSLAGRSLQGDTMEEAKRGYQLLLEEYQIKVNLEEKLVIFPEMSLNDSVPEITVDCWGILNVKQEDQMCASERMVVKREGEPATKVVACTLLAYDKEFELGETLKEAEQKVYLNHKFCARFCVLGGASCSSAQ